MIRTTILPLAVCLGFAVAAADNGPGTPYCFSNSDCPCGNVDPNAGCANSTGAGAFLSSSGSASASADDLVLTVSNVPPNQFGILFMGGRPGGGSGSLR